MRLLRLVFFLLSALTVELARSDETAEQRFLRNEQISNRQHVDVHNAWHITDDGLRRLRSYVLRGEVDIQIPSKVVHLDISGTAISDAGIRHLMGPNGAIKLRRLIAGDTLLSENGVLLLGELPNLKQIDLGETVMFADGMSGVQVSDSAVERLRNRLPDCEIQHRCRTITLTEQQKQLWKLWSEIAHVRVGGTGEIRSIVLLPGSKVTEQHRASLSLLHQLRNLSLVGSGLASEFETLNVPEGIRHLSLRDCRLRDPETLPLCRHSGLRTLDLSGNDLTDACLEHLNSLNRLSSLNLRQTEVTTAGLQQLRRHLPETHFEVDAWRVVRLPWKNLTINEQFQVQDVGVVGYRRSREKLSSELQQLLEHPTLESISLRHSKLTDEELKMVGRMRNLREVDLGNTQVTSAGLQHLSELTELRKLNLWHTRITGDGGLAAIEKLPVLESLELDETRLDDRAIVLLARMKNLRYTELWHTDVTAAGIVRLKRFRPQLEVKANPRD